MALEYCIDLKDGTVCVPIPVQVFPWPWWMEVLRRLDDPEPHPWVIDEQLGQIHQQDLAVLAAIEQLSEGLSSQVRRDVRHDLKQTIEKLKLPAGRKVIQS